MRANKTSSRPPKNDLTGSPFGKVTVKKFSHRDDRSRVHWLCDCECGREVILTADRLLKEPTLSCGCENSRKRSIAAIAAYASRVSFDPAVQRQCRVCLKTQPLDAFGHSIKKASGIRVWKSSCKTCSIASLESFKANLNANEKRRFYRKCGIKSRFGLTEDDYRILFERQEGRCAICRTSGEWDTVRHGSSLFVDHNHANGKIRGLLCRRCNSVLGSANDDHGLLIACISYLEKHRKDKGDS